jgi:uncharacterized protein (TIGR00369 family)
VPQPTRRVVGELGRMRGVFTHTELGSLPGSILLGRVVRGELPHAPIYRDIGLSLVEVNDGTAVVEARPSPRFYNPIGSIHGGYVSILLDTCMGCAVHSRLPAGTSYATIEIKVNFVRPLVHGRRPIRAHGSVIHVGRRIATAEARLVGQRGELYAHGVSTSAIFPLRAKGEDASETSRRRRPRQEPG